MGNLCRSLVAGLLLTGLFSISVQATVKIAVVGAMSGQFEAIGDQYKTGVNQAVKDIAASNGFLGKDIEVLIRDDRCDPEQARLIAQEIAGLNVSLVVGGLCSGASIAGSKVYAKHGIVQISPSSTAPSFTERGLTNVFRTCGRDDVQGFVIAESILRRSPNAKIAIVFDGSVYSNELAQHIKKNLNKTGVKEVIYTQTPKSLAEYSDLVAEIERAGTEIVVFPSYPEQVSTLLHKISERRLDVKVVGGDTLMWDDFPRLAGDLTDGVEFSFPPDPAHDVRNRKLVRRIRKAGGAAEGMTFYAYAAVQVWAQAVSSVKSYDGKAVANSIRSDSADTVLGKVTFDEKGDISVPGFVMYQYLDGEADYLLE